MKDNIKLSLVIIFNFQAGGPWVESLTWATKLDPKDAD